MAEAAPPQEQSNAGFDTLVRFLPMLWPKGETELKARVIVGRRAGARRQGGDACHAVRLQGRDRPDVGTGRSRSASWPMLVAAYATARFAGVLADNLRNALFEKVGQNAARRLAGQVFRHIHDLSLRFHLERRTGSLTKIVERGTKSIDMMLYFLLFNIAPTVIELTAICVIFFVKFGAGLVAATLVMVAHLHRLHPQGDRLARADPARHERGRQQGHRPRGRLSAELRDRQIFRRRGARGEALRRGHRRLRQGGGAQRDLARLAQHRPELHHQSDDGRGDDLHRLGLEPRPVHARRRGAGQLAADAAVPAARHARLGLSLDPPGPDRHGSDVRPDRYAGRGRRQARRASDRGEARPRPVRRRALRLRCRTRDPEGRRPRHSRRDKPCGRRTVRRRQVDPRAAAVPFLRSDRGPHPDRRTADRRRRTATRSGRPSGSSRRTRCCSTTPSATTSPTAATERRQDEVEGGGQGRGDRRLHDGASARL